MQPKTKSATIERHLPVILIALAVVAVILSLLAFYSGRFDYTHKRLFTDGDTYALLFFYDDIANGVDIAGWRVPPALKVLPDMLLYFPIRALSPNIFIALPVYGLVQFLLFVTGLLVLAKHLLPDMRSHVRFGVMALMVTLFLLTYRQLMYAGKAFVPIYHFGVVVLIPWMLAVVYRLVFTDVPRRGHWVLLLVLNILMGLSDSFYIVQFTLPLSVALLLMPWLGDVRWKRVLRIVGVMGLGCALGFSGYLFLARSNPTLQTYVGVQPLDAVTAEVGGMLRILVEKTPWHAAAICLYLAGCLFVALRAVSKRNATAALDGRRVLYALYFLAGFALNLAVVLVSGLRIDARSFRYFLPSLLLPAWLTVPYILRLPRRIPAVIVQGVLVLSLLLTMVFSLLDINLAHVAQSFTAVIYPDFNRCVDENAAALDVHKGIANFWQARPLTALTQADLQVVQVLPDFQPYYWNNNLAWYAMQPEFIVFDEQHPAGHELRLDEALALERFGEPDTTFTCETSVIWVYSREDSALRDVFDGVWKK